MGKIKNTLKAKLQTMQQRLQAQKQKQLSKIPEKKRFLIRISWSLLTAVFLYGLLWAHYSKAVAEKMFMLPDQNSESEEAVIREKKGTYCITRTNQPDGLPVSEKAGDTMYISRIPEGRTVQALAETTADGKDWMKIDYCGIRGWIPADRLYYYSDKEDYIQKDSLIYVNAMTQKGIKAYKEPSADSGIVAEGILYGEELRIKELKKGWGKVKVSGKTGWINMFFAANYPGKRWKVIKLFGAKGLNLRETPEQGVHINAKIPEDTVLLIKEYRKGWGYTAYRDQTGWVNLRYLFPVGEKEE